MGINFLGGTWRRVASIFPQHEHLACHTYLILAYGGRRRFFRSFLTPHMGTPPRFTYHTHALYLAHNMVAITPKRLPRATITPPFQVSPRPLSVKSPMGALSVYDWAPYPPAQRGGVENTDQENKSNRPYRLRLTATRSREVNMHIHST